LIDGLRPGMHVGGVQLELAERGGFVDVVVGLRAAAVRRVHVEIVVGQQQFAGIEDHVVDRVRSGRVGADKVRRDGGGGPVAVHAAADALQANRRVGRRRRQLSVVIHRVVRCHRRVRHQIQRVRTVLGLDGGVVLQLLAARVMMVADDAVTATLLLQHLLLLLVALLLLVVVVVVMVQHRRRGGRLVMVVVGGRLVVLPSAAAAAVVAALPGTLVDGTAAQVQHGRRRTLVVVTGSSDGRVRRTPVRVLQLEHVVVVGRRLHRLTVDRRRGLRPRHEPEVHGGHVLDDRGRGTRRRRQFGRLQLLQDVVVVLQSRRPVLVVMVV